MRHVYGLLQFLTGCSTLNSYILKSSRHPSSHNRVTSYAPYSPYTGHNGFHMGKRHPEESPVGGPEYPNQAKRSLPVPDARQVVECMTVSIGEEGMWRYESTGNTETCGIYIVSRATSMVQVTFEHVDVDCDDGLIMFFDGWELNGHVIPPVEDHPLSIKQRSGNICSSKMSKRTYVSSQNAALVSFNVPTPGQGFVISIKILDHPNPCNILMSDLAGVFTLTNYGQARNCSLTTMLFPANFELLELEIGPSLKKRIPSSQVVPYGDYYGKKKRSTITSFHPAQQCSLFGAKDFVELGGSPDLDSSDLETKETLCGFSNKPSHKGMTVLCGSSTVRLVSSGSYTNSLTVLVKAAGEEDLDFSRNLVMACASFA